MFTPMRQREPAELYVAVMLAADGRALPREGYFRLPLALRSHVFSLRVEALRSIAAIVRLVEVLQDVCAGDWPF